MSKCVVRCVPCMRKPMVLLLKDGGKDCPPPGVLFYAMPGYEPTIFPDREKAVKAINASLAWRKGDPETEYEIQSVEDWGEEQRIDKLPPSKRRTLQKTHGKNPAPSPAMGARPEPDA